MAKQFHFISGLPRAGSTLLSALLRQNPAFHARVVSPVYEMVHAILPKLSKQSEFHSFFDRDMRQAILTGIFQTYYTKINKAVIFDSNRLWTTRLSILFDLFPDARIICMVRDVHEILNSFEGLLVRNPLETTAMFGFQPGSSIYSRMDHLMNSEVGTVGLPWLGLREAWYGPYADRLILIDYDRLVSNPQDVMAMLYDRLGLAPFRHDTGDVAYEESVYDHSLGIPGLHAVRKTISRVYGPMLLPPDLVAKNSGHSFWKTPQPGKQSWAII